jgi:cephalosporin hydroxylase
MVDTRPELVVETGTYRGGSAAYLASICDLLGAGEVVSIDIEQVRDDYPVHPRITYLGGRSSTHPDVRADVRSRAEGKRTLVILDSDHSQGHVETELAEYAPLVPVGGYVIVEDSNIGQIRKDLMPGPLEAIETFLAATDDYEIDRSREKFLITFNPSGYLRRIR